MDATTALDSARIMAAIDRTWPPAEMVASGGWCLRRGTGGGKRVSAASPLGGGDIADAETAMRAWGQVPMFRLIAADAGLDADLASRGYTVVDPVSLYAAPVARLVGEGSHVAKVYRATIRPAFMEEIWKAGGIGDARLAIMDRVDVPSRFLMARIGDSPCGAAFVAIDDEIAMIHAIEVLSHLRRHGAARLLVEGAARFAQDQGAAWLALAVTEANTPARALYEKLGMEIAGRYHYRVAPDAS